MKERLFETPHGPARVVTYPAKSPRARLILTHGAGGGIDAIDLVALAEVLPKSGYEVHLLEMPWRLAGKKVASRPAILDECFSAVFAALKPKEPVVIGGRSAGARVSCRLAGPLQVDGVLALAFPLHPPGRPESSRLGELESVMCPRLVVQGEKDAFGGPSEFPPDVGLVPIPFGDHSLKVPKRAPITQNETLTIITDAVLNWLESTTS
ncbi:MAG TPA: alpha/beta family hydrolase [Marmoricola sp.]|nr:alpha/beta family hydrolase [Marmoricola sp.]